MAKLGAKTRIQAVRLALLDKAQTGGRELSKEQVALLELLARGGSITRAAQQLAISQRTAARCLAQAGASLGVTTNAEAIVAVHLDG